MIKIGIVGHRFFKDPGSAAYVANECDNLLTLFSSYDPELVVVSAIAAGADSIFAQAALDRHFRLEIVRPFDNYVSDFITKPAKSNYELLRSAASSETVLNYTNRSATAYATAMQWVARSSDILVAAWDGLPARGMGGTADAVDYAVSARLNWIHIDVVNKQTFFHLSTLFPPVNTYNYYAVAP
ncbi:MAG: hypothetical protein H7Z13_02375 [Ferruginibacter sp.]|nr:hypothetical protein [Ferruginibacter sp.]